LTLGLLRFNYYLPFVLYGISEVFQQCKFDLPLVLLQAVLRFELNMTNVF